MADSINDLLGWFFGTQVGVAAVNDVLKAKLQQAKDEDATFDDLIALLP